ncbi:MAG: LysM peptidoglycan-binding domain-containing protein [bacterium]
MMKIAACVISLSVVCVICRPLAALEKKTPAPGSYDDAVDKAPSKAGGASVTESDMRDTAGFTAFKRHTIERGDTLWSLARRYYSDPYKWRKIYEANISLISDPHWIYPPNEITIPDITEEVKPEFVSEKKEPEVTRATKPVESVSVPPEAEPEQPFQPQPVTEPVSKSESPSFSPVSVVKDMVPPDISAEMPTDAKGGYPSLVTVVVPIDWREDGSVIFTGGVKDLERLAVKGESVRLGLYSGVTAKKGDIFKVYKRGTTLKNKAGKKVGLEIQKSAVLRVTAVEKEFVEAEILEMNSAVEMRDVVKKD